MFVFILPDGLILKASDESRGAPEFYAEAPETHFGFPSHPYKQTKNVKSLVWNTNNFETYSSSRRKQNSKGSVFECTNSKKKEDGKTQIYKMYEEKKVHLYGILYTHRCKISLPFPINPIHPV